MQVAPLLQRGLSTPCRAEAPPEPAPFCRGPWVAPVPRGGGPLHLALAVLFLGTDPEETILHAFKVFDTEGKGFIKADL